VTPDQDVERLILTIRGAKVILDSDLAALYRVPTYRFNEAFKRHRDRFPTDFAFQLSAKEFANLRLQVAAQTVGKPANPTISSQIAMRSRLRRGTTYRPWAFTEHGALQAANILNSKRAVQMSVFVIRAFIKMREQLATNATILKRLADIDKTLLIHDSALRDVYQKLLPLLTPSPPPPRKQIGFHP
jgi:hypothetical protein